MYHLQLGLGKTGSTWPARLIFAFALFILGTAPLSAQLSRPASVTLRNVEIHPKSELAALTLLKRLENAALEACGGYKFSLREVNAVVRRSPCWHAAVARAVAHIDSPLLSATFSAKAAR
jgi:hypothetical protein